MLSNFIVHCEVNISPCSRTSANEAMTQRRKPFSSQRALVVKSFHVTAPSIHSELNSCCSPQRRYSLKVVLPGSGGNVIHTSRTKSKPESASVMLAIEQEGGA